MNRTQIFGFLNHRMSAKTRHGVHSPFVYRLIEDCIYASETTDLKAVMDLFEGLKRSNDVLRGVDLGKSRVNDVQYSVGHLARTSSIANYQLKLLCRLANYHQPAKILELGTNLGKTTAALSMTLPNAVIHSVEGNAGIAEKANQNLAKLGVKNTDLKVSSFNDFLTSTSETYDYIFLDGDHSYEATLQYFHVLRKRMKGGGPLILHDIYWSKGMREAWQEVCAHPKATVTIDLYAMGLVYFRPEQEKEHFQVRFPRSVRGFL